MRWRARAVALVAAAGCNAGGAASTDGVELTLDIPNAALDPKGYTEVDVTLHTPNGDLLRSASVNGASFDLGELDPMTDVSVEATLRTATGTAVGYGRTAQPVDFAAGAKVTVPVRRPIIYIAGMVSEDQDGNPNTTNDQVWSATAGTFSDLAAGTAFDGSTTLGTKPVMLVAAGPDLYLIEQAANATPGAPTTDPATKLTGSASIKPVSTGDHTIGAPLQAALDGGVRDGVGSDDGKWLAIGTTAHLYVVDTAAGMATAVADGDFARVAMINHGDGTYSAIAIADRGAPCNATAKLVSAAFAGNGETMPSVVVGTGGFADVASDNGRAFAVDACKGELVEIAGTQVKTLHTGFGLATALAVSNGSAYIGIESKTGAVGLAIQSVGLASGDTPRTLWQEESTQIANAADYPGVQRSMDATSAAFAHLEIGAGDDYLAATAISHYHGDAVRAANFPELDIDTEELRVFDTSTGSVVERYRSWCDGTILPQSIDDIENWACATTTGQTAPTANHEHHIQSMTFQFGKK